MSFVLSLRSVCLCHLVHSFAHPPEGVGLGATVPVVYVEHGAVGEFDGGLEDDGAVGVAVLSFIMVG